MRWLASGFFLVIAAGCLFVSGVAFVDPWHSPDTPRGIVIGIGVFFLLLACGAAYGAVWAFRRLDRQP